jgi:hypothetical protein
MKSIEIKGKRNIDGIQKIKNPKRLESLKWNYEDEYFTHPKQVSIINQLYLDQEINYKNEMKREIQKKINGYKYQDIDKKILNNNKLISLDQTFEKLVESKLKCFYCKEKCFFIFKDKLDKKQWTLDRIDNEKGHNYDNIVISCLDCNVKRGEMNFDRFKKGKDIKIIRKIYN